MRTIHTRVAMFGLAIAALFALDASRASAQGPTPEGTTIQNEATASFTDANGNTYTDVTASVSITVGFLAGPTITQTVGTANPNSPSAGNTVTFTITNNGNGTDQFSIAAAADAGLVIDHYSHNGTDYADLTALNVALAAVNVDAGDPIDVDVVYDVDAGQGGNPLDIDFTVTSVRDAGSSDSETFTVTPATAYAVTVTADDAALDVLPSNGGQETITFDVQNTGTLDEDFDLEVTLEGTGVVTIVSVNGTPGATSTVNIASGGTASVSVVFTVNDVAGGSSEDVTLTATSQTDPANASDSDLTAVNVERPLLAMTKVAYRDDGTTVIGGADEVVPGEFIRYEVTVTNNGGANAVSVEVSDPLAPSLILDSVTGADWTFDTTTTPGTVVATLTSGSLAPGASSSFVIRVQVE